MLGCVFGLELGTPAIPNLCSSFLMHTGSAQIQISVQVNVVMPFYETLRVCGSISITAANWRIKKLSGLIERKPNRSNKEKKRLKHKFMYNCLHLPTDIALQEERPYTDRTAMSP